jgi:hypothetical protein
MLYPRKFIQFALPLVILRKKSEVSTLQLIMPDEAKLSLCLINYALRHEDIKGNGVAAPQFLTLALDGSEWSTSIYRLLRPQRYRHRGKELMSGKRLLKQTLVICSSFHVLFKVQVFSP